MPDATAGKVPIIECVRSAWMFLIQNWRMFLAPAAIVAVVSQIGPVFAGLAAPQEPVHQTALGAGFGEMLVTLPAAIAGLVFAAAVLRKAVRNEFVGTIGLAFGPDEMRLVGATLALACLFIPLVGLVVLVLSVAVFSKIATSEAALQALLADPEAMNDAIVQALGEGGAAALSLFILVMFCIFIYLAARLYLINAATIGEKRIVLFQTWSWSRGNVLRMIAAMILTVLPVMVIDNVVVSFGSALLGSLPPAAAGVAPLTILNALISFATAISSIPVTVLGAIFYKGLRPPDFAAK